MDADATMDDNAPPAPVALPPDRIREIFEVVLSISKGASNDTSSVNARAAAIVELYPEFAEAYPKLLQVACASTTPTQAQSVRSMLAMMLDKMSQIDAQSTSFEDASKSVGVVLGETYMPQLMQHPSSSSSSEAKNLKRKR